MDAFNVVVPSGGASAYEVWVGEAANTADLAVLKQEASILSGSLVEQNASAPGLIMRRDVSLNLATPQATQHYMLSGAVRIASRRDFRRRNECEGTIGSFVSRRFGDRTKERSIVSCQ